MSEAQMSGAGTDAPPRLPLSVVILAKNEECNIQRCVAAVDWADEVVVVDDGSTDRTVELAQALGARLIQHEFESFASQRNWAMSHANLKHDWVLHLDADEVATIPLSHELKSAIAAASHDVAAFRMCRKTILLDRWLKYSDGFPVWIMRLVRRNRAVFIDCGHGEVAVPEVDGTMLTIQEPFLHYAFSKGLTDWIARHNRYSTREAELELQVFAGLKWKKLFSRDRAVRRHALRSLSRRLPFRPTCRFLYQYVLKRGFLDGRAGWTFSRMMAMYEGWIVMKRDEMRRSRRGLPAAEPASRNSLPTGQTADQTARH
ncbi:MAG: glycosyltransferase family 2 protein [Planctomycetaceae bacterium]